MARMTPEDDADYDGCYDTYYKLMFDGWIYGLVRSGPRGVESWQPVAQEWIPAPWHFETIHGWDAHKESEIITTEEAEVILASGTRIVPGDVPPQAIAYLRSQF